jgi:DNA-binding Lrp family transcriptional regulator
MASTEGRTTRADRERRDFRAIEVRVVEGKTWKEAAAAVNLSPRQLRNRRRKLRELVEARQCW